MFSCSSVLLFFSFCFAVIPLLPCSSVLLVFPFATFSGLLQLCYFCSFVCLFLSSSGLPFSCFFYHFSILLGRFCSVLLQLYYFVTLSICSSRPPFYFFFSFFSYGSPVFVSFFIFATMLDCSSVHLFVCSSSPPSFFFMFLPGSFLFFYKCLICSSVPPVLFCKSLSFVSFNLPFMFFCYDVIFFPLYPCSVLQAHHPSFFTVL